jgi:hypothetical protein
MLDVISLKTIAKSLNLSFSNYRISLISITSKLELKSTRELKNIISLKLMMKLFSKMPNFSMAMIHPLKIFMTRIIS